MAALAAFEKQCRGIVGATHVSAAGPADTIAGVPARLVVEAGTDQEVAAVLQAADSSGLAVAPRGGGTKLDWGNPPSRADAILSTARLDQVVEHAWADMTATVQAGCPVARFQEALAQNGQRLAVDVLWPGRATIGGVLATNDSGALRLRYGALRDLIIGATVALADGTLAASGGKVVKNVAGYDVQKLMTGALGTLGVITKATFRLHPLPYTTRTFSISVAHVNEAQRIVLAIQDSSLAHAALQIRIGSEGSPVVDALFEGTEVGLAAQATTLADLARSRAVSEAMGETWTASEELWTGAGGAIAKLSVLPTDLAATVAAIDRLARDAGWGAVLQATGIGWLRLDGPSDIVPGVLRAMRSAIEGRGGSLVVVRQPAGSERMEVWGDPGDALPLMRAVKQQLDPRGTLNPGRFVGGI